MRDDDDDVRDDGTAGGDLGDAVELGVEGVTDVELADPSFADEAVEAADDVEGLPPGRALAWLRDAFGEAVGADYATGKTALRDALVGRFGVSELAAEETCDALEAAGDLAFVDELGEWRIHGELGVAPRRDD